MINENKTLKELQHLRILVYFLICVIAGLVYPLITQREKVLTANKPGPLLTQTLPLPYYKQIMNILDPLEYSGVADMIKPEVDLQLNFTNKRWKLTNIHKFDARGNILLDQDRYGLCGELAAHTFTEIEPFLKDKYDILFVKAAESGFFLRPHSTHIVLMMIDKSTRERYFIDPSFRRYGRESAFSNYYFFETADHETHLRSLTKDIEFPIDVETPLVIRNDFLICLGAESIDGKFDKDNFTLALTANKRHEYSGRYVFMIRLKNGKIEKMENKGLLDQILSQEEVQKICGKVTEWFTEATGKLS